MNKNDALSSWSCKEIALWFMKKHKELLRGNKLISWAEKLGVKLNRNNVLDETQLFSLFVLAILWNNKPTYSIEKGEQVFKEIRNSYTLENFRKAIWN